MRPEVTPDRLTPEAIHALKTRSLKSRLLVTLFRGLARAPHRFRQSLGWVLGQLAPWLLPRRCHIVDRNLALCFSALTVKERHALRRAHFRALAQSLVDRSVLWFGTPNQIRQMVHVKGREHIDAALNQGQRIMLLAPHFVGLDAAATRLTLDGPRGATLYAAQADADVDAIVKLGRSRFNEVELIGRRSGTRALLREIEQGTPIYYLPDMDLGARGAVFVPFFGVMAATQTAPVQLAQQFNMTVLPVISTWFADSGHYEVQVLAPLGEWVAQGQDTENTALTQATARLNRLLEKWIRQHPEQYYWVHRRFKTRPPHQKSPYSR